MRLPFHLILVAAGAGLLASGCKMGRADVNEPLPAEQVAAALQNDLKSSGGDSAAAVHVIVEELQTNDWAGAFVNLKALSAEKSLSENQRITVIRAGKSIGEKLKEAAQNGDAQATQALQTYRSAH